MIITRTRIDAALAPTQKSSIGLSENRAALAPTQKSSIGLSENRASAPTQKGSIGLRCSHDLDFVQKWHSSVARVCPSSRASTRQS
jgi:hypothetical protein